jgi:hypothetical protein
VQEMVRKKLSKETQTPENAPHDCDAKPVLHNDATQQNSMLDFKQVGVWTNFFPAL